MRYVALLAFLLCAASSAVGAGLLQEQQPAAEPAKVESGPELFVSSGCSHCHAIDGIGGVKGPDLSGIGRRWKDDQIRKRIEEGALEMPAYKDVLNDEQIVLLVNYLHARRARERKIPRRPAPAPSTPASPPPTSTASPSPDPS